MNPVLPLERHPLGVPPAIAARLREGSWQLLVTGGSGWLGLALLEQLHGVFGAEWASRVQVFGRTAGEVCIASGERLPVRPLDTLAAATRAPALLFHLAYATREKTGEMSPEAYLATNRALSARVLGAARALDLRGVFLPSSGAVYAEDGRLETSLERNPYGMLKLEDETAFATLARERGARALIARVFNLSGPYIGKPEHLVLSMVLGALLRGEPVRLKATQPVYRSYVFIGDLLAAALGQLTGLHGPDIITLDTAGEQEIEVGTLASLAAALLGHAGHPIERPDWQLGIPSRYVGRRDEFLHLCHRLGLCPAPLDWQILATAAALSASPTAVAPR